MSSMGESTTQHEEPPRRPQSVTATSKSCICASTLGPGIARLPRELLYMVFKEITPQAAKVFNGLDVLALTHVCRLWRDMVVAEASLWSHINLRAGYRYTNLFIQRSQGLSLTVYAPLNSLRLLDEVLDEHALRVRAIHVDSGDPLPSSPFHRHPITLLHDFSSSRAPEQLECFSLRARLSFIDEASFGWTIFAAEASPLKALSLDLHPLLNWIPTNSFPRLTHLCLSSTGDQVRILGQCSGDKLLRMLSGAPMLEYLHLFGLDLYMTDYYLQTPVPVASLDRIRTFSVHGSDVHVAFYLLRHLELPQDCLLCIGETAVSHEAVTRPFWGSYISRCALDIPPLDLFETMTFLELSASFGGFLLAGYDAQSAPESGFFIDGVSFIDTWPWFRMLHTVLPFSNVTVLHANFDELAGVRAIFPSFLTHFSRLRELSFLLCRRRASLRDSGDETQLVELFFRALAHLPTTSSRPSPVWSHANVDVACPALEVLGLEAELAHADFPFAALESMAASRMHAGCRLPRFVFHPHTGKYDTKGIRAGFFASFARLAAFVDGVEYRRAGDAKVCPFAPPGCWDDPEAERYWELPRKLWYGVDTDVDLENSDSESGSAGSVADDRELETGTDTGEAKLVS
ncbi:hypothetical protein V8D89_005104 [Ganoderma adspersum]